jgi:hypothetical protein
MEATSARGNFASQMETFCGKLPFEMKVFSRGNDYGLYGMDTEGFNSDKLIFAGIACGDVQLAAFDTLILIPSEEKFEILFFALADHHHLSAALVSGDRSGRPLIVLNGVCLKSSADPQLHTLMSKHCNSFERTANSPLKEPQTRAKLNATRLRSLLPMPAQHGEKIPVRL